MRAESRYITRNSRRRIEKFQPPVCPFRSMPLMNRAAQLLTFGIAVLLSSCGRQVPREPPVTQVSGYALIFQNRPIVVYPDSLPTRSIIVNADREVLPVILQRAFDGDIGGSCVAHLYRLSVTIVHAPSGSATRLEAKAINAVETASASERDAFIIRARSSVLDQKSVCATARP